MTENETLRAALATLLLHATGNNGPRDGNPYTYRAVREAAVALFPDKAWSDVSLVDVRKAAVCNGPRIALIVKGNANEAEAEAQRRGLPYVLVREHKGTNRSETILDVPQSYHRLVANWFESTGGLHGPYPAGTLLHYGDRS